MTLFAMNDNPQSGSMPAAYDAIIVLAHHLDGGGELDMQSRARIDAASAAYQAKQAFVIFTTGWDLNGTFHRPIAETMRDVAIREHGVPAEAIRCDVHSRDTVGDAIFTKRHSIALGAKRLLVITSAYHVPRAKAIFAFIYGPGYELTMQGTASAPVPGMAEKEHLSLAAFEATFAGLTPGDDAAIWQCLRTRHPFYNGAVYPAIAARPRYNN